MNNFSLIGNIVGDVKLEKSANGVSMVKNAIAYNDRVNGEKVPYYFDFVAWSGTAELIAKYFKKGDEIGLTGKMTMKSWTGKEDNKPHKRFELLVDKISFTRGKTRGSSADIEKTDDISDGDFSGVDLDVGDLPF